MLPTTFGNGYRFVDASDAVAIVGRIQKRPTKIILEALSQRPTVSCATGLCYKRLDGHPRKPQIPGVSWFQPRSPLQGTNRNAERPCELVEFRGLCFCGERAARLMHVKG